MKKGYILLITAIVIITGLYIYYRSEAQKKGWHKSKFWADAFGVAHYTEAEADLIAGEFEDIFTNPFGVDAEGWTS